MRNLRIISSLAFAFFLVFSCEKPMCGCVSPPSPLAGEWALNSITYPMTNKTITAAEAGYSETLSYDGVENSGKYKQVRNGLPLENTSYTISFPKGGSTEGIIYYNQASTEQTFRLADNKLYLSERIPRGATLADGATYEYRRQ